METPEISIDNLPELRHLRDTKIASVEVNTYKTRGEPFPVVIEGEERLWHSVKGGIGKGKNGPVTGGSFEILYNPETDTWLKIVPPETSNSDRLTQRLKTSVGILKVALEIAKLPELVSKIDEFDNIDIRNGQTYGFISPHFGPTVEFFMRTLKRTGQKPTPEALKFFSDVYKISFVQAVSLFLDYECWMQDPNPGNILLVGRPNNMLQVVNTDFANSTQIRLHRNPPGPQDHMESIKRSWAKRRRRYLERLFDIYDGMSKTHKFPFIDREIKDRFFDEEIAKRPDLM